MDKNNNILLLFDDFYQIDLERYDIINLTKKAKVTIISKNFNLRLIKSENLTFITYESLKHLLIEIKNLENPLIFFFINKNEKIIHDNLKGFKCKKFSMHYNAMIPPLVENKKLFLMSVIKNMDLKRIFRSIRTKLLLTNSRNLLYDYVVTAGDYAKKKFKNVGKYQIDTISRDFQLFKNFEKNQKKNLDDHDGSIVFCDSAFGTHPDEKSNFSKDDVENFYEELDIYFRNIEQQTKKKIIIAAHPKRKFFKERIFYNRKYFINETCSLIKKSRFVIGFVSTSFTYAILYKKPILLLNSNHIKDQFYKDCINKWSEALGAGSINISKDKNHDYFLINKLEINEKKYQIIYNQFICNFDENVSSIWDTVFSKLKI